MKSTDIVIEPATKADEQSLVQLLHALFDQEAEFQANAAHQLRGLRMIMAAPEVGIIMIAKMGGRVVGMVNLLFTVSTALGAKVAILEDMVVSPDVRGAGVGSMLLRAAIAEATRTGCQRITLLTDDTNVAAQTFYAQHGFVLSAMRPMRKLL